MIKEVREFIGDIGKTSIGEAILGIAEDSQIVQFISSENPTLFLKIHLAS